MNLCSHDVSDLHERDVLFLQLEVERTANSSIDLSRERSSADTIVSERERELSLSLEIALNELESRNQK